MRIAIVEWWPRICGATDWGMHLSAADSCGGLYDIDRLTFSKSGKQLTAWSVHKDRWQVHRTSEAIDVLNTYDLIILTDIASRARADGIDNRDGSMPYYVEVMQNVKTPWTTMIHDGAYNKRLDPVIDALLKTKSFSGSLITTRFPEAMVRMAPFTQVRKKPINWVVDPYLPYDDRQLADIAESTAYRAKTVTFVGRLTSNKGQDAMIDIVKDLDNGVVFWGMNAYGLPSWGWRMWEQMEKLGFTVGLKPQLREDKKNLKHPNAPKFYTGKFLAVAPNGNLVAYNGDFISPRNVAWSWFSVGLSNTSLTGTLEYSTLDGIAAGCVAMVPKHQLSYGEWPDLIGLPYKSYSMVKGEGDWDRELLTATINMWMHADEEALIDKAARQRAWLRDHHSPTRILKRIVGSAY